MKKINSLGFSLIEIVIGFSILLFVGAMFLTFLQSSSKEAAFSSEIFDAVVLSQKVSEDILEELAVNPYGLETLGVQNSKKSKNHVVDRDSIFFSYFEDRKKPYGQINPERDGGLDETVQPLYDSVKKFKFNVTGKRIAESGNSFNRNLVECDINFSWGAKTGKGRYMNSVQFFSPVTEKEVTPQLIVNQASIDARIPAEVFNKSASVGEIAAQTGENAETILALGRIAIISRDFLNSPVFKAEAAKVNQLTKNLGSISDIKNYYETTLELALAWYELAKYCYQIVMLLDPQFAILQLQGKFVGLTGSGLNPMVFELSLMNFQVIYEYFVTSLINTRYYFYKILEPEIVKHKGTKTQLHAILKLIDLYRVTSLIKTRTGSANEYRAFLQRIRTFSEHRNPFLYRMVNHELILISKPTEWLKRYPNLERLEKIISSRVPNILEFIKKTRTAIMNEALQGL